MATFVDLTSNEESTSNTVSAVEDVAPTVNAEVQSEAQMSPREELISMKNEVFTSAER